MIMRKRITEKQKFQMHNALKRIQLAGEPDSPMPIDGFMAKLAEVYHDCGDAPLPETFRIDQVRSLASDAGIDLDPFVIRRQGVSDKSKLEELEERIAILERILAKSNHRYRDEQLLL